MTPPSVPSWLSRAKKTKVFQDVLAMNHEMIASVSINDKGGGYVSKDLSRNSHMGGGSKNRRYGINTTVVLIDCTGSLVIAILFFLIPPTER